MTPRELTVRIDELVLDGVEGFSSERFRAALERELGGPGAAPQPDQPAHAAAWQAAAHVRKELP
jgi:hypothetical protein